ncbi:hypothetical protein [Pontibacter ruber]|uniref:Uncharacterized protein n=1 Tax=Pontibacter ruber TaxID=1343895 RepID=A0ABW5CYF1_9BACT|nr:hypothetical protein [Pontibacter ruber]
MQTGEGTGKDLKPTQFTDNPFQLLSAMHCRQTIQCLSQGLLLLQKDSKERRYILQNCQATVCSYNLIVLHEQAFVYALNFLTS